MNNSIVIIIYNKRLNSVTKNAFLNVNVNFDGQKNDVVSCQSLGSIDFSHWRVAPTQAPTQPPPVTTADPSNPTPEPIRPSAEPVDGPNSPGDEVNHAEVGCRFADRRMKLVICGGADQPWGNDELESLLDWMKRKNGVIILFFIGTLYLFYIIVPTKRKTNRLNESTSQYCSSCFICW